MYFLPWHSTFYHSAFCHQFYQVVHIGRNVNILVLRWRGLFLLLSLLILSLLWKSPSFVKFCKKYPDITKVVSLQLIMNMTVVLLICVWLVWILGLKLLKLNSQECNISNFYSYIFIIKNFELAFFLWICCECIIVIFWGPILSFHWYIVRKGVPATPTPHPPFKAPTPWPSFSPFLKSLFLLPSFLFYTLLSYFRMFSGSFLDDLEWLFS